MITASQVLPSSPAPPRTKGPRRPAVRLAAVLLLALFVMVAPNRGKAARPRRPSRALPLDRQIDFILHQAGQDRGNWGIEVARLPDGKILYQRDANHLFHPASNMKLLTTAAALELVGPDFIFRTTVETEKAPDAAGRVGDVVLVGRGDPNLSNRVLPYNVTTERQGPEDGVIQQLADQVKAHGVRDIMGNLIVDDRYFVDEPYGDNWGIEDMLWGYGAPVTAVAFNDNEMALHVYPAEKAGDAAVVMLDPSPGSLRVVNRVQTVDAGAKTNLFVERLAGSAELDLWGEIPMGGVHEDTVAIPNPPLLVGGMLRRALEARGIKVHGDTEVLELLRMDATGALPSFSGASNRVVLAEHDSLPLREEVKVINKVSQNLHCEMLLRTIGQVTSHEGSVRAGLDALQAFLSQQDIDPDDFYLTDGSGLSRTTLIAPEAIIKLLQTMARSEHFQDYFDSLPVAGVDGLLENRMRDSRATGNIHAKTGTLTHVNALSGYMDLPSGAARSDRGTRLAFSILGNDYAVPSEDGVRAIDAIALAIYEKLAGRPRSRSRNSAARHRTSQ
jgi:serine-type D-Ala-D-Ala carboxypeptidase/endopeptidase (penicillin-binding protein 4)